MADLSFVMYVLYTLLPWILSSRRAVHNVGVGISSKQKVPRKAVV